MMANHINVEQIIQQYIEHKEQSLHFHKKRSDAEKEYNKLLVTYGGEIKNFTLDEADRIYKAYQDMLTNEEQSRIAEEKFSEVETKLKEVGRILLHATINADIRSKQVTVSFPNGEVFVR